MVCTSSGTSQDRALLATLFAVIPKARRHGLRLLVTPDTILRWHRDIVRRRWAARSIRGKSGRPATRRNIRALVLRLAREIPAGATAGSTANWPGWEYESRRRRSHDVDEVFGTHSSRRPAAGSRSPRPTHAAARCCSRRE